MKRDSVSDSDPLPPYAAALILDDRPSLDQLRTYLIAPISTEKHIKTFEYRIHWNINIRKNKFLYEKIKGSVARNKHSGKQY